MENQVKYIGPKEDVNNKSQYDEFLKNLELSLNNEVNAFNLEIKKILLEFYSKINRKFINIFFLDNNDNHTVELYNETIDLYFTLYYSKNEIQLIINEIETIYFYTDNNFSLNYKILLENLFAGNYNIISVYNKELLVEQELQFIDQNLIDSSIKNEYKYLFKFFNKELNIVIKKKGFNWVQY